MPAPAVYAGAIVAVIGVVAVGWAFKEFVYEPHIAPTVEVWADNYVERRRRRRQRQGPLLAQPVNEHADENRTRRSSDSSPFQDPLPGMNIELEQLAARERAEWMHPDPSGLRRRRTAVGLDESNTLIPHPIMEPTHVLYDTSEPPSPSAHSIRTSAPPSVDNSPAHPTILLQQRSPSASPRRMSPRLPTPMSMRSGPSSPMLTPTTTFSEHSSLSSRRPTPDLAASQALTSAYNTPLGGSMVVEDGRIPSPRIESPFSDIHAADPFSSSPDHPLAAGSPLAHPVVVHSPSISSASDLTLDTDDEFDVLSPRSGIFSPSNHADDDLFDLGSEQGSEVSWTSVGRRSPVEF